MAGQPRSARARCPPACPWPRGIARRCLAPGSRNAVPRARRAPRKTPPRRDP